MAAGAFKILGVLKVLRHLLPTRQCIHARSVRNVGSMRKYDFVIQNRFTLRPGCDEFWKNLRDMMAECRILRFLPSNHRNRAVRFLDAFLRPAQQFLFSLQSLCLCDPAGDQGFRYMKLNIVGLGGSLRPKSSSAAALELALKFVSEKGHETTALLLSDLRLPGFETCETLNDYPESVLRMLQHVRSADAVIFSTPVYHGTLSGEIKNAMDFLEYLADDPIPYLTGKVIGLISTSGGSPGINAINTMDYVSRALHGWVCPTTVAIPNSYRQFDENGNLKDEKLAARILKMANELEFAALRFKTPLAQS